MSEPPFLDAAVRIGLHLAGRAAWQAGTCAWPAAGARPAADVYAGSAGIAWFLAEVDRIAPHPALRRAADGGIRHALRAAQALEGGEAASFYHGRVGVACAAARAAALWGRDDLREGAEALLRPLAEGPLPEGPVGVRHGAAGAVPALLEPPGPLDEALCRALAVRLGERILQRAEREPWGWSWTDPGEVYVRPPTGLGHGAAGVGRASLELFRALGDGRHRYAAEQALLYERRFFEPTEGAWFDLRHPWLTHLLQHEGPEGLEDRVRREGGGTPWLGNAAFAWCHGAVGIGLVRLRAWQLVGRASYRAEAEAAVRAALAHPDAHPDPGLCHGVSGSGELLLAAARVLDRPEWRAAAEEAGARVMAGGRLRALPAPGAASGAPLPPGVMLGEAGAGWFLLRLHDASTPSVLLPGAESSPAAASSPADDAGDEAYAGARREHVDAFFGAGLGALARHGAAAADAAREAEAAAGPERSAPLAVYRALRGEIAADKRAPWARDVAVDLGRFELLLGIADLAEERVDELRREAADALEWNGDTLLHASRRARVLGDRLLLRTGPRVEEHVVGAVEARVLVRASRAPVRAAALADADPLPDVLAAARALYARGALDVLPGATLADATAAYIAAAVTDPVPPSSFFRNGAAQVRAAVGGVWEQSTEPRLAGAPDPLLLAWQGDSAAAALQRALPFAAVEPLFRDDLEAYWREPSPEERRRILAELAAVLRAVFGHRPFVRAVYFSAPVSLAAGQADPTA
ncbi:MAG TPA: lanthionine synthetase LanC family protein [Longimicrobium sp.]|nr:lanthionine synthetase LanC family protein [Longimicrobium sp.]